MPPMYDVPSLGEPFALRGQRDVALVLDEFTPTHLDAWLGRALLADGTPVRAVVVRHAGNVVGSRPGWGRRRRRLDEVLATQPQPEPVYGIVVETGGASVVPLAPRDPALLARDLSRADWRHFL